MRYKPNWPEAKERLTALWHGDELDRPCIAVRAPSGNQTPCPPPTTPEQKWLDPGWLRQAVRASLDNTWWGGEALPSYLVMSGWLVCFGGAPRFEWETIWWEEMDFDFDAPPQLRFNPAAPWVQRYQTALEAVVELAGKNDFLVGRPCILPANDLLSMLMGTDKFLLALMDHPDWMAAAIRLGARAQLEGADYFQKRIRETHDFWYGNAGWMPFWSPEPYQTTQSDVSCMLSPAMFDQFVLPELEIRGDTRAPLWYHLDGGNARQHLERLLSLPYLRVLQYTPAPFEPPNGPEHLAFYKKVQDAGKIVHIQVPPENVLPLVRELDPRYLMLDTHCRSRDEAEDLLVAATDAC